MTTFTRTILAIAILTGAACGSTDDPQSAQAVASETTTTTSAADRNDPTDSTASTTEPQVAEPGSPAGEESPTSPGDPIKPGTSSASPTSDPRGNPKAVYAPPPGVYIYDMTGTIEESGLTGTTKKPVPTTSTDDIRVSQAEAAMRMVVVTRDEGDNSTQEIVVAVTDRDARLVRLSRRPDTGVEISVNPDPPALLARFPYRLKDQWEIAWNDPGTGVSGVGTGTVERQETISTPAGRFDTVVVTVVQKLRGTVTGTLTVTTWIDPATGVQPKQHTVTDLQDATGASRTDTTRTLRTRPA